MKKMIAPSILSADFCNLASAIEMINNSEADWIHIDVMDGVFVPNITIGMPVVKAISKIARKPLDVHLMITEPSRYIDEFARAGASCISVHYEACTHLHRTITKIKDAGIKAGAVLNPHSTVELLTDIVADCDFVLLMSVNPGFGGQKFIENTYSKIERLKNLIIQKNAQTLIEIDGGVDLQNAPLLFKAGADILVAGNTVFSSENPIEIIAKLKE